MKWCILSGGIKTVSVLLQLFVHQREKKNLNLHLNRRVDMKCDCGRECWRIYMGKVWLEEQGVPKRWHLKGYCGFVTNITRILEVGVITHCEYHAIYYVSYIFSSITLRYDTSRH
jgi:hypothetical protein